jgi:predicted MPP superfamily phosphohydrolase
MKHVKTTHSLIYICLFCFLFAGCSNRTVQTPLVIAQLCDPQLGMYNFAVDSANFEQEIRQVNELSPDVVAIAGDMANDVNNEYAVTVFLQLLAKIQPPVILTAGNHDLPDPVSVESLKRYRSYFGNDFNVLECKGRRIISANSQLWREAPPEEVIAHDLKLREALQEAKKKEQPVIMLTHIPPFVVSIDEDDAYKNMRKAKRSEWLNLFEDSGVFIWLAGHTHKTDKKMHNSITILNGETTSKNFDQHPKGFRLLTIYPDQHFDWEFVQIEDMNENNE